MLATPKSASAEATANAFSDNFDGTTVDLTKWDVQQNVDSPSLQGYGGIINVSNSYISLTSDGNSYPEITCKANPFPETGDFVLQFDITYTRYGFWGTGIWVSQGPFLPNPEQLCANILHVWSTDGNTSIVFFQKTVYETLSYNYYPDYYFISPLNVEQTPEDTTLNVKLEFSNDTYTLYMNGTELASEQSDLRADTIGFGHPPVSYVPFDFAGTWTSFKINSISVLTSSQPSLSASSHISISAESLSTVAGSPVNVFGTLTDANGSALQNKTVVLSYTFSGISSWEPISSGLTDEQGNYALQWINSASGTFTLKAEWSGDETADGASNQTSLSFLPYQNQQQNFIFESNSTIYDLSFNSTESSLTFNVTGPSGTTGYVRATIAKSLLADSQSLQASMDGKTLDYSVDSTADAWVFTFNYSHSTHHIALNLASNQGQSTIIIILACVLAVILCTVAVCVGLGVYSKKISNEEKVVSG